MINRCRSVLVKYTFSLLISRNDQTRSAFVLVLLGSPILTCLLCHFGQASYSKFIFFCWPFVFRVFAKIVENSIIILFAILGNNLIIHRAIKIRTFAISQSCAASFKAKSSKPIRVRTG